ncbi:MAG: cupredoxin domain-containing protein [Actinobacteria bacterium]|nr:cupredoxin domain-containing protein [Actinomycetota bacterium]
MIPLARCHADTTMRSFLRLSTTTLVAVGLLAGCGGGEKKKSDTTKVTPAPPAASAGAVPGGTGVTIKGFKYVPPSISTTVGAKLTFKNVDNAGHTATADMKSAFDSGTINHGQSKTVTFKKAGTFAYHCDFHPFMHGSVVVKPATPASTARQSGAQPSAAAKSSPKTSAPQSERSGGVNGGGGVTSPVRWPEGRSGRRPPAIPCRRRRRR